MRLVPQLIAVARIARRDAWRHRGRSVLVALMVALPVLGLIGIDVLARTIQLSPTEQLVQSQGHADVSLRVVGGHVRQKAIYENGYDSDGNLVVDSPAYAAAAQHTLALLPAGSRTIEERTGGADISAGERLVNAGVDLVDLRDPMLTGYVDRVSGRLPAALGEVVLSHSLASRLGVHAGSRLTVGNDPKTMVGVVRATGDVNSDKLWGLPGSVTIEPAQASVRLLGVTPQPVTWSLVQRLNAIGVAADSRYVVARTPGVSTYPTSSIDARQRQFEIGVAVVTVGLAVLEVVLLAGAAFAVGARRQRRELALIAATGADATGIRRLLLCSGLVLGAVGALAGAVAGLGVAAVATPHLSRLTGHLPGHFDLRPAEILAVVALGLVTGLLAAVLPARAAARDDIVAALAGRRGITATPRRVPLTGVAMIIVGALLAGYAAHPPSRFTLMLVGAAISELGFVVCAPAVVGAAGRVARWLPLTPRLAVRDASRHRGRTGPAVAAIMAAIAGSIAVSTYIVSTVASERAAYQPTARIGQTVLMADPQSGNRPARAAAIAHAERDLGATGATPLATFDCTGDSCVNVNLRGPVAGDPPCVTLCDPTPTGTLAVGDGKTVAALVGHDVPAADAALARGAAVTFSGYGVANGHLTLQVDTDSGKPPTFVPVDAVVVPAPRGVAAAAVLPRGIVQQLGAETVVTQYLLDTPTTPTTAQEDRANADIGSFGGIHVERGYQPQRWNYGLLALTIGAAIVTLGATAITTGLSTAESRPDLATLGAVGGAPHTRRLLAAWQAGTVAILGSALGVVAGLIPAWSILTARQGTPFTMPWSVIAAAVLGLPLLAMLVTGGVTRSRLPIERRIA